MAEARIHTHIDGITRCAWCGDDPVYMAYHDEEWGVPEYDSKLLFEKLMLDGFQAGLSWITILRKRNNFRAAFDGFDPEKMARYTPKKLDSLMNDAGIVRNGAKIAASVGNARAFLEIPDFSAHLWGFVDGKPLHGGLTPGSDYPVQSDAARAVSKDLLKRGFKFVGPTIVYAFMQATGMIDDHIKGCHRSLT